MDTHTTLVIVLATIMSIFFGIITDDLFIGKTKNKRAYLRPLGILIFGL